MKDFLGPGLGPERTSPTAPARVILPPEIYVSPVLDMTVPNLGIEIAPARPGHTILPIRSFWIVISKSGTQTSPATASVGTNAAHTNILPSSATTPSNANVNAAVNPVYPINGMTVGGNQAILLNTPAILDVTAGTQGTGGYSLRARFAIILIWFGSGS